MESDTTSSEAQESATFDVEMSNAEIETVLRRANHGVLSLADDGTAYAIPMSYGFDPDADAVVFQFVNHEGSRKRSFVDTTETASFTVSRTCEEEWFSIVAEGSLSQVPDDRVSDAYAAIAESAWFPDLTVFDGSVTEAEFELVELSVDAIDGRKAPDFEV